MVIIALLLCAIYILYLSARYLFESGYEWSYYSLGGVNNKISKTDIDTHLRYLESSHDSKDITLSTEGKIELTRWVEQHKINMDKLNKLHDITNLIVQYAATANNSAFMYIRNTFIYLSPSESVYSSYKELGNMCITSDNILNSQYEIIKFIINTKLVNGVLSAAYVHKTISKLVEYMSQVIPELKEATYNVEIFGQILLHYINLLDILEQNIIIPAEKFGNISWQVKNILQKLIPYFKSTYKTYEDYYNHKIVDNNADKYSMLFNRLVEKNFPTIIMQQGKLSNFKAYCVGQEGYIIIPGIFSNDKDAAHFYIISGDVGLLFYTKSRESHAFNEKYVVLLNNAINIMYHAQTDKVILTYVAENKEVKLQLEGKYEGGTQELYTCLQQAKNFNRN